MEVGAARFARADTCSDCPEPSLETLAGAAGVGVDSLALGLVSLSTDAGECRYAVTPPTRKLDGIVIVWEAQGMAWNCPFGSADSEIKLEIGDTSQYSWTVTASGGLKLSNEAIGELSASFGRTDELSHARSVLASITTPIKATVGHKLRWHAYYFAGQWTATAEVSVERRFAWWTKPDPLSSEILKHGDLWMACGNGAVAGRRLEAIAVCLALKDYACSDTQNVSGMELGWYPPLPPDVPTPHPFPPDAPPPPGEGGDEPGGTGGPSAAPGGSPSGGGAPPGPPPATPPAPSDPPRGGEPGDVPPPAPGDSLSTGDPVSPGDPGGTSAP